MKNNMVHYAAYVLLTVSAFFLKGGNNQLVLPASPTTSIPLQFVMYKMVANQREKILQLQQKINELTKEVEFQEERFQEYANHCAHDVSRCRQLQLANARSSSGAKPILFPSAASEIKKSLYVYQKFMTIILGIAREGFEIYAHASATKANEEAIQGHLYVLNDLSILLKNDYEENKSVLSETDKMFYDSIKKVIAQTIDNLNEDLKRIQAVQNTTKQALEEIKAQEQPGFFTRIKKTLWGS